MTASCLLCDLAIMQTDIQGASEIEVLGMKLPTIVHWDKVVSSSAVSSNLSRILSRFETLLIKH